MGKTSFLNIVIPRKTSRFPEKTSFIYDSILPHFLRYKPILFKYFILFSFIFLSNSL